MIINVMNGISIFGESHHEDRQHFRISKKFRRMLGPGPCLGTCRHTPPMPAGPGCQPDSQEGSTFLKFNIIFLLHCYNVWMTMLLKGSQRLSSATNLAPRWPDILENWKLFMLKFTWSRQTRPRLWRDVGERRGRGGSLLPQTICENKPFALKGDCW